ncbi:anti-FecI sigma factor, FecR [Cellulophaga algicola DSM 14237]|uniref:Anti-FecI sigma factor, FecR n=1 Tax=Cellulophaga algicola (strain DSM 14237 / IC166 / ACAM 630) TaxID=688270 RepID=E6XFG6_CELAD|nr:FecR family protein [Cellulophaga algicola]ADV51439.1 anti-FecI sigma factor, FecR [Cellulophaga algicola DSM 14237]
MEESKQHLLENLLEDTSFKNWVYKRNRNDVAFWNKWIDANSDYAEIVFTARDIILGINFKNNTLESDFIEDKLKDVLSKIDTSKPEFTIPTRKSKLPKYILAGVTFFIATLLLLFYNLKESNSYVVQKTGFGETINLKLSDGTTVVLNGNSELKYDEQNPRNVLLQGEAYFKVKSKPSTKAKFWVTTTDLKVEVFGTHFNVNTRDEKTKVLLDEGSIQLELKNGSKKKMNPGEIAIYSNKSDLFSHKKINSDMNYSFWREETFVFNNISLLEVMHYLENSYGVTTEFKTEKSKKIILTGGIPNGNLKICIKAIEKSAGIKINHIDNNLVITNN